MKYKLLLLLFIIQLSCKQQKKHPKQHNPFEHITQTLKNNKAIKLFNLAKEDIEKGNLGIAKENLKKSFEIEKSPIILNELATLAIFEKNYTLALFFLNNSISNDKTYYPSHINKSRVLTLRSDFENAKDTLNKMLVECKSDYWKAYGNLYLAYIYLKGNSNCEEALECIKKSELIKEDIDLKPQYEGIKNDIKKNVANKTYSK
ncbi:hypothetical protein PG911_05000 [Tenacibaculum ovolyticum]|uniref:hypothetical protein n=1 Tax=Tenacibaculum ovolyticum TaxID=104270 RepID=UPI0022F3C732|nr:hypothetical protein [Tenacibaculum ovolyticum]WBX77617.1 hypothetical protein PG911_05000 [Tenacibaculum ovolyticum]